MNPVEFLYFLGYTFKKKRSLKQQKRLPRQVVSIGNLTAGGTGKTPAAIAVAEEAKKRGYRPVILTRGYRGKAAGPCLVGDGHSVLLTVEEAGDEPVVMADRLKGVPVIKAADRYEGGMFALQQAWGDDPKLLFILDDGFQHWRLHRDVDIVLVDGQEPFGNRKLLPVGPLRGPLSELKSADMLVITRTKNESLARELKGINADAPVYLATHEVAAIRRSDGTTQDPCFLKGRKLFAFCGIARPASFRKTLTLLGGNVIASKRYRDHHRYTAADIGALEERRRKSGAEFLVATEKDMVKIKELNRIPDNLLSVEISFKVDEGFYEDIFQRLKS